VRKRREVCTVPKLKTRYVGGTLQPTPLQGGGRSGRLLADQDVVVSKGRSSRRSQSLTKHTFDPFMKNNFTKNVYQPRN